jgi:hypothetical protein
MIILDEQEKQLIEEIGKRIAWYSTALIRINSQVVYPLKDIFIGCGTFVQLDGQFGILTAQHVVEELAQPCQLGLILEFEKAHRFVIDSNHFTVCEVAIPNKVAEQPDLAFIGLYPPDVGTIKAHKQFVNLTSERDKVLPDPLGLDKGAWFIWGAAAYRNTIEPPEGALKTIIGIHVLCGPGLAVNETQDAEHDYIDIQVAYGEGYETPNSFQGYSGGGLWQVPIEGIGTDSPTPIDCIYSGVIFYQFDVVSQKRLLHCHGRRSVYEYAYKKIQNRCA